MLGSIVTTRRPVTCSDARGGARATAPSTRGRVLVGYAWRPTARVGVAIDKPSGLASADDVASYRDALDGVIESLDGDMNDQFVWMDPTDLTDDPDDWRKPLHDAMRAKLIRHAKGKSAAQVRSEIDYGNRWVAFRKSWQNGRKKITLTGPAPPGAETVLSGLWDGFREDHARVIAFYAEFKKLGGDPSAESNPGNLPDKILRVKSPLDAPELSRVPWGWIIAGVVLLGGALMLGQVRGVLGGA